MISFHKETAPERYLNLKKSNPEIIEQLPLHIIASYLGITKHSLGQFLIEYNHPSL
jgi:hypothetical protein